MARLICDYCGEPIKRGSGPGTLAYDEGTNILTGIDRAYHIRCHPDYAEPFSPFQAAVQKAKQAIADAQRLGPEEQAVFREIVGRALTEQRQPL